MSDRKRKDSQTVEPSDAHLREAHLAEGVEKHTAPVFAPLSTTPIPAQLIAPIPLLAPPPPSPYQERVEAKKAAAKKT